MRKYMTLIASLYSSVLVLAQVHVRDEPRHHNVFENKFVRILDVHLGPNDTTLYHLHNTPSVFILFTNTQVSSQLLGGQPQKGANVKGVVSYDSLVTPRIHRVWNEDTSWFHVMDVELTSKLQKSNTPVLQNQFLQLLFNEQQVNGYRAELKPGGILQAPASAKGYLIVSKAESIADFTVDGKSQHRILKPGHYIWMEAGRNFSLHAITPANFVLLQIK
jgi:quercetin dioxygenase-like cupin family protein